MNIIRINSVDDSRLDAYYRTSEKALHKAYNLGNGYFIAESELVINRALDKGYEPVSFLCEESCLNEYKSIFDRCNSIIDVYVVSNEVFVKLKGYILIRGIMAIFKRKADLSIKDVCLNARRVVVLDNVENPTNVGAILRNCAALFVDGVLLTDQSCDPLYRRSIRVSMGNVFNIKHAYIDSDNYIEILHNLGYKVVCFALRNNSINIEDAELNKQEKLAIVLGSEGYGISQEHIDRADYVCKIDMNSEVDSLNVASASAIALWQLCKK